MFSNGKHVILRAHYLLGFWGGIFGDRCEDLGILEDFWMVLVDLLVGLLVPFPTVARVF